MRYLLIISLVFLCFIGTSPAKKKARLPEPNVVCISDSLRKAYDSLLKTLTPLPGYRFVIYGDFDGDKKIDTLFERYTDSTGQIEEAKYYDSPDSNFDYGAIVSLTEYLNKKSFLIFKNKNIKLEGGKLGFHYAENCGDLNLDGKDEVLIVKHYADWSNCNTAYIYTLNKNKWKEIYSFHIWEWQLPETPAVTMMPGMMGNYNYCQITDDSLNLSLEKELREFRFIKYYPDASVEFSGMNPIPIRYNSKQDEEYEKLGAEKFIQKYYDTISKAGVLYFYNKKNKAILYRNSSPAEEDDYKENVTDDKTNENNDENEIKNKYYQEEILLNLDDSAAMITARIYLGHKQSPFRKKR